MARYLAAIEGSRGEVTRLGTGSSGIRAQAQGWDIGIRCYGEPSTDPATPDKDVFFVYVTGGSHDSFPSTLIGHTYLESDGSVSFEPSDWLIGQCLDFRPDLVKPADTDDCPRQWSDLINRNIGR